MSKIDINSLPTFDDFKKKSLRDPKVKAAYDALEDEFKVIAEMIDARQKKKLTQAGLAKKAGMQQAAIARLESGKSNPRYKTLNKIAKALDKKIAFVDK